MALHTWLIKRNKEIVRLVLGGKTCTEVAYAYGLCTEMIRQIVVKEGYDIIEINKKRRQKQFNKRVNKHLEECEKFAEKLGWLPTEYEIKKTAEFAQCHILHPPKSPYEKRHFNNTS